VTIDRPIKIKKKEKLNFSLFNFRFKDLFKLFICFHLGKVRVERCPRPAAALVKLEPTNGHLIYLCSQCRPRLAGTSVQSDHGLHCLLFSQDIF
jgi:hypothetical protein